MNQFKSINKPSAEQSVDKKALFFGLTSVLLYGIGFGLTTPVVPFLVQPCVSSPAVNGIASNAVSSEEQGRIQGGNSSYA